MAVDPAIQALFTSQVTTAQQLYATAQSDVQQAFRALQDKSIYTYTPYAWQLPSPPVIGGFPSPPGPSRPGRGLDPVKPTLLPYGTTIPNPTFGVPPVDATLPPAINFPTTPTGEPTDNTGTAPGVPTPNFPGLPTLLTLPPSSLPYPFITIPTTPTYVVPVFDGIRPDDINSISLTEYLQKLTDSYTTYSNMLPTMIQNNCMVWFRAFIGENPNIRTLDATITTYLTAGGTGVPTTLEEAIITRAVDRVTVENRRANAAVWENVTKRGLILPSGALMAGLREARQTAAEATSKVSVDVAIKNLELEHQHMEFMMKLGVELQTMLLNYAGETGKVVTEINGQAIELTKLVLTGMVEINNALIRIFTAKWEGYKAAVEVFRAKWMAIEAQIKVFEAQIKAEMTKTEVNKAVVEVLRTIVEANKSLVEQYKIQVDAETAKIETARVQVMAYEATVRGYVARVEAFKARWDGYKAGVDGQLALAKVYEAQEMGYKAKVDGYAASVNGYKAQVEGYSAQIEATSKQNDAQLKSWSIQLDGQLKAYAEDISAYGENWKAIGEQAKIGANITGIQAEFLSKMYTSQIQIDIERAREHLSQWQSQLQGGLQGAAGVTRTAEIAASLASTTMNGLTAFAGNLNTSVNSQ